MGPAERLGKLKSEFNLDLLVIGRLAEGADSGPGRVPVLLG